jgi:acyl dehydratase
MNLQKDQEPVLAALRNAQPKSFDELRRELGWASRTRLAAVLLVLQEFRQIAYVFVGRDIRYRLAESEVRASRAPYTTRVQG